MFGLRLQGGGGGGKGVDVPHLLFANSTLLFCIPYSGQLTYMSWIPQWFKASAGLKVNLNTNECSNTRGP